MATMAGRARGFARSARKREEDGDRQAAARLYLKAASALVDAAEDAEDADRRQMWLEVARSLHRRGVALRRPQTPSIEAGGPTGEPPDRPEPAEQPTVTFDDVAGLDDVKEQIRRLIIRPLRHPEVYRRYGLTPGGGILLHGPPGCGKTLVAQAAAGESGASFFPVHLADVLSKYVGESEKAIRRIFEAAHEHRPSVVFLDEIDALGSARTDQQTDHGKRLLNQLLSLMDGGDGDLDGVLVLGATNMPKALDPALVRAGRFTRKIEVPLPDASARREIARRKLAPLESPDLVDEVVEATAGESGAEVEARCEEILLDRIEEECRQAEAGP